MSRFKWRYLLQAVPVYLAYGVFKLLPLDWASALGGCVGRTLGPKLGARKKVLRNLARALPELDLTAHKKIQSGMWENLGRVMAEYPHLKQIGAQRIEVVGLEPLLELHRLNKPFIVFSGHFANWEVIPVASAVHGLDMQLIYRHANNPYVDRLLRLARTPMGGRRLARKGVEGARSVHGALRHGRPVGMLVDQKHNRGMAIPFFGHPAMTATAIAELCLRYDVPIFPVQNERLHGARFRLTVGAPFGTALTSVAPDQPQRLLLTHINSLLEQWVRAHPEQWLWLHRRWSD